MAARGAFVELDGVVQPAPRRASTARRAARRDRRPSAAQGGAEALRDWGFDDVAAEELRGLGVGFVAPS